VNLGVGALIVNARGECLLLRRLVAPERGTWSLPGGKVESEEMPNVALQRELLEELGVGSLVGRYLGAFVYRSEEDHFKGMSFCYEARLEDEPSNREPSVHSEIKWFSLDNLPAEIAAPVSFAVTNYRSLGRHKRSGRSPCQVALVQPFFPFADKESLSIPLGLATLHASLKQEAIPTNTYDCSLVADYDDLRTELPVLQPKVIGVQFHSEMSLGWATRTARYVRQVCPESVIVAGGETATFKWRELLVGGVVDYVVYDEGEITFVELVRGLLAGQRPRSTDRILEPRD